ncbi:hypothetical protein CH373_17605 [Leptospira perolatii]|uniref:FAD-binding domain-containing protein n=1 Tax=Leptospira perolatii TaxID=2023191 RepID=A0A2M9ZIA2_9LEPT|nr:geranylgeranyl reductase family protein [Leptospira perolatii]PJZ69088.1 hypothetical protein CH360_12450 [Leptospira perolatii]PJZ71797.1 hypothetical protein CH373_17605 [Leptospira perolatii]
MKVLIIGGGPAGASAAYFLAKAQIEVTVIDKAKFPRDKTCGDGVSARAFYTLFRMGIRSAQEFTSGQEISSVYQLDWYGNRNFIDAPRNLYGNPFSVISRKEFDHALITKAVGAGATLIEGVSVTEIRKDGNDFRVHFGNRTEKADVVVGADGVNSLVRSKFFQSPFLPTEKAFAYRAYFENVNLDFQNSYHFVYLKELYPGYAWIFPLSGNKANIGVSYPAVEDHKVTIKPEEAFENLLSLPSLQKELKNAKMVDRPRGYHIPMRVGKGSLVKDSVFLCGDSAGLVDPITGDGIDFALESGSMVAEDIIDYTKINWRKRKLGDLYNDKCHRNIVDSLRLKELQKKVFLRKNAVDRYFKNRSKVHDQFLVSSAVLGTANSSDLLRLYLHTL